MSKQRIAARSSDYKKVFWLSMQIFPKFSIGK
jgi:hypothetical protein